MRITKPKRGQTPTRRLDLTDMRSLFRDRRMWSAIAIVQTEEGESTWWEIVTGDGGSVDVLVSCVLQPSLVPVIARLRAGLWEVPNEGDEVAILIPEGETDFMPILVARLSSGSVPTVQGPEPGKLVIVNGEVLVHDGAGGAVPLALKSDVDSLASRFNSHRLAYNGHLHAVPGVTVGAGSTTSAVPSALDGTATPSAAGTTVLKGK